MIIELALLPPAIAEQVKQQVEYGKAVQFAENGKVLTKTIKEPSTFYDVIMSYHNPDVGDIELPEFKRTLDPFEDPFKDD